MTAEQIDVLLVEDDVADAMLVRRALGKATGQFNLSWAGRLSDAMAQLASHHFDVALVDLSLPDSRGLDTVLRIRQHSPKLPIILLTGNDSDETAIEALDRGAQDYLVKDQLFKAPTEILVRSIRYAFHRQKTSENQRLLEQLEINHTLLQSKNQRLATLCQTAEHFVENVSHEFRTPLTVIKEYTSLMRCEAVGPVSEEQSKFLNVIENRADDLNRMVDDMLDGSRLDAGLLVMSRTQCDVAGIVAGLREMLERKAASRNKTLEFAVEADLPAVYCDPEKIGRVIVNLVVNAIKFCGEPGYVKVRVRPDRQAKNIVVSVSDNGRGLEPEDLEAIFGRFQQTGDYPRQRNSGFGLGLSIAKELVDLSFGRLTVQSEPQKGSTFTFTVPVAEPLEIVSRGLSRLSARNKGDFFVSLLSASASVEGDSQTGDDVHFVLNDVLRANDLLFRVDSDRWLIVIASDSAGVEAFSTRMAKMLELVNRNRPRGALPRVTLAERGTWLVPRETDQLQAEFAHLVEPAEAMSV